MPAVIPKLVNRCTRLGLAVFNRLIVDPFAWYLIRSSDYSAIRAPVFIIGAPRCGSTLCAQVLIDAFHLGTMTNLHCRFYHFPALAEHIFPTTRRTHSLSYQSEFGMTHGRYEPAECRAFWARFFPRDLSVANNADIKSNVLQRLQSELNALSAVQDRPLLLKNLYNSMFLVPLVRTFPESLFIIMKRGELDNARSIFKARQQLCKDYGCWWSVPVPGTAELMQQPPEVQVTEQIRGIYRIINRDLHQSGLAAGRCIEIDYNELCRDTGAVLDRVESFFRKQGLEVSNCYKGPAGFTPREETGIDPELDKRLAAYINGQI